MCDGWQTADGAAVQSPQTGKVDVGGGRGHMQRMCKRSHWLSCWSTRNMQTQICNTTPVLFMWELCSKINDHFAKGCGQQTGKQFTSSQCQQEEIKYWTETMQTFIFLCLYITCIYMAASIFCLSTNHLSVCSQKMHCHPSILPSK